MKIMRWFLLASVILLSATRVDSSLLCGSLALQHVGDDFWVVLDDFPDTLQPDMLYNLYSFLKIHVEPSEESPLYNTLGRMPVVLRFADDGSTPAFPHGTEGFAGLTDLAEWRCYTPLDTANVTCQISSTNQESLDSDRVLLAVVSKNLNDREMIGVIAHELAHTLGAVDGLRCPANDDYNPMIHRAADFSDTYWWYGVVGVFTSQPQGIVWDALNGQCDGCDVPEICYELEMILSGN